MERDLFEKDDDDYVYICMHAYQPKGRVESNIHSLFNSFIHVLYVLYVFIRSIVNTPPENGTQKKLVLRATKTTQTYVCPLPL